MRTDAMQAAITIREIDHIVLRVVDLARMQAFYGDVLGCREVRRQDEIGLVQLRAGSSMVDLIPLSGKLGAAGGAAPGKEGRNVDHFCFRVEPFDEDAIRAHLAAHGIEAGPAALRRARRRATSTTCACASSRTTRRPSNAISRRIRSHAPAAPSATTAPRARVRRSTSPTRTATRSS